MFEEIDSVQDGVEGMQIEEEKKAPAAAKRVKKEVSKIIENKNLKDMIKNGDIEKQTVGWIKDVLAERGIET